MLAMGNVVSKDNSRWKKVIYSHCTMLICFMFSTSLLHLLILFDGGRTVKKQSTVKLHTHNCWKMLPKVCGLRKTKSIISRASQHNIFMIVALVDVWQSSFNATYSILNLINIYTWVWMQYVVFFFVTFREDYWIVIIFHI